MSIPHSSAMALRCLSGIIVLVVLVAIPDSVNGRCDVFGVWKSEHGTLLTMKPGVNRSITGSYQSSVGAPKSPLIGYQQEGDSPTFGVTVKNIVAPTITVITGQCYTTSNGERTLGATWIRREQVGNSTDDWKSSLFGSVNFSEYVGTKG